MIKNIKSLLLVFALLFGGQEVGAITVKDVIEKIEKIEIFLKYDGDLVFKNFNISAVGFDAQECSILKQLVWENKMDHRNACLFFNKLQRINKALILILSHAAVEGACEVYGRVRNFQPRKNTPGVKGFFGDWYKRCVGLGKDGFISRDSFIKLPAKLLLTWFLVCRFAFLRSSYN